MQKVPEIARRMARMPHVCGLALLRTHREIVKLAVRHRLAQPTRHRKRRAVFRSLHKMLLRF